MIDFILDAISMVLDFLDIRRSEKKHRKRRKNDR